MVRKSGGSGELSQRQRRVGELLRGALSESLSRGNFRDPQLASARVTVTEVRPNPDLRSARVYVIPLGGGQKETEILDALQRAAGYLRHEVNSRVKLKFSPALKFELDHSFDEAQRINSLLNSRVHPSG